MNGFFKISNSVTDDGRLFSLDHVSLKVFLYLSRLFNASKGYAYPPLTAICDAVGAARRSVVASLRRLMAEGLICRKLKGVRGRASRYVVPSLARTDPQGALFPMVEKAFTAAEEKAIPPVAASRDEVPWRARFGSHAGHSIQTNTQTKNTQAVAVVKDVAPSPAPSAAAAFGLLRSKGVDGKRAYEMSGSYTLDDVQSAVALLEGRGTPFTPGKLIACVVGRWADEATNQPQPQGESHGLSGPIADPHRAIAHSRRAARAAREYPETFTL